MLKSFPILIAVLFIASNTTFAAIALNSPTTDWHAIAYPVNRTDYINDQQTGDIGSDLVGSVAGAPVQTALYYKYDAASDEIGFRIRIHGVKKAGDPFDGVVWVGFMLDSNDSVDLFAGFSQRSGNGNPKVIGFHAPGDKANVSPSTTSIVSQAISSKPITTSNSLWTPVTVGPSGNDPVAGGRIDVGNPGVQNYFLTWIMPFSDLQAAATSLGFNVTANTPLRLILGTSNQVNAINQDLNGTSGNIGSSSTYANLGAASTLLTPGSGPLPVPEPGVVSLGALGAAYVLFHLRSRRRR